MSEHQFSYRLLTLIILISFGVSSVISGQVLLKEDTGHGQLLIKFGDQILWGYQYGVMYPPVGIDSSYGRSGFVHPIHTLSGHRLTRIQPDDHYHHYGLWNPWTRVLIESDTIDFWNLKRKQGTVRFAEFKDGYSDSDHIGYQALHEHVVLKNGKNKVVLNEIQNVKVYPPESDHYIVDLKFEYSCATESEFKILAYRYQGLGWRATEEWNNENSKIITSEGKTRLDADNSFARWFVYQGKLGDSYGGMMMLSAPDNYNHPEPIRVWPSDVHDGAVYANFVPTKNKDWLFQPGEKYVLQYRLIIFNNELSTDRAETLWKQYSNN